MEIFTQEYKRLYHQYPAVLSKLHNSSSRILQGLPSGLFGPTILDLTQVYEASVEQLSYNYLFDPSGGIVGAFFSKILKFGLFEAVFCSQTFFTTAGWFMEKYKHLTFIYAFLMSACSSFLNGSMPFYGNVNIFLGLGFVRGFLFTAVYTGK